MPEILLFNSFVFITFLLCYVTLVFLIATLKQDNSVMDIAYGPAFFVSALGTYIVSGDGNTTSLLILIGMGVWATRLSVRIGRKNWGKPEDARYANWRNEWMKRGSAYFLLRSYIQVNLLQGFIIFLVAFPFILALSSPYEPTTLWLIVGSIIYLFGLTYESVADWQLDQFLARKRAGTEPAVLMTSGLFRYSRRPNYFGETLIWWGFAFIAITLPFGYLALISPLVITYIVTKVTGPMLEKIFLEKYPDEYRAYMATTNYFVPGLPK